MKRCVMQECQEDAVVQESFCMEHWLKLPVGLKREAVAAQNALRVARDPSTVKPRWIAAMMACWRELRAQERK